jgi:hypothetical protein
VMDDLAGTFLVIARNYHGWKGKLEVLLRRADVGFSFCSNVYDCLARIYSVKNIENLFVIGDSKILSVDNGKFLDFCEKKNIKCMAINDGDLSSVKKYLHDDGDEPAEENYRISEQEMDALFSPAE